MKSTLAVEVVQNSYVKCALENQTILHISLHDMTWYCTLQSRNTMSGLLYSTIYGTSAQQHVSVPVAADETPKGNKRGYIYTVHIFLEYCMY